jgi:hypothetical protein
MGLTLIALLLAGFVGCDATPEEPVSESEATLKSAEQGDANAQFNLGLMYRFGNGVPAVLRSTQQGGEWRRSEVWRLT